MNKSFLILLVALMLTTLVGRAAGQDNYALIPSRPLVLTAWVIACACLGLSIVLSRRGAQDDNLLAVGIAVMGLICAGAAIVWG